MTPSGILLFKKKEHKYMLFLDNHYYLTKHKKNMKNNCNFLGHEKRDRNQNTFSTSTLLLKKKKISCTEQPLYKQSWEKNIYINRFSKKSFKEKFINLLMVDGKKSKAYNLFNKAGDLIRKKMLITRKTEQKLSKCIEYNRIVEDFLESTTKGLMEQSTDRECRSNISRPTSDERLVEFKIAENHSSETESKICEMMLKDNKNFLDLDKNNAISPYPAPQRFLTPNGVWATVDFAKHPLERSIPPTKRFVCLKDSNGHSKKLHYLVRFSVTKSLYQSLDLIKNRKPTVATPSLETLLQISIENIKPTLEVRKVRIAGTTYQVPAIISKKRQETLAIRWIIQCARKRKQSSSFGFAECLAQELLDAYNKQGLARQKRDELHKIAESNRAYIRYRWW